MVVSLEGEVWKPITGYEDLYQISNLGRVKRNAREWRSGKNGCTYKKLEESIVTQRTLTYGYNICTLCKDGVKKSYRVHRLVAFEFCDGYKDGLVVNHKDGNKSNNISTNLEWITSKENAQHSVNVLNNHYYHKYSKKEIQIMENMFADGMRPVEIAKELNVPWQDAYAHSKLIYDKRNKRIRKMLYDAILKQPNLQTIENQSND